jgi:tetratricopeptide (TPR) repeat protein
METNLVRKLAAYQLYGQARSIPYTSENAFNKCIELHNRAIVEDPDFGEAYAELAHIYEEMSGWMLLEKHAMSAAKQNALRALLLDDSLAVAHLALGNVLFYHELDFADAEKELRRAIELDSRGAGMYGFYAKMLSELGRFEEAEQVLSPRNHSSTRTR